MIRLPLVGLLLGLTAPPAFAHKLIVKVTVTELAVDVHAEYEGGDVVPVGSKVAVVDRFGTDLSEGVTDEAGDCRLPRPEPGVYTIAVDDHQGHYEKVVVDIREGETTATGSATRNRWLAGAIGLALIAGVTVAAMRRKKVSPSP
jgi:hypothetical protein